ASHTILSCSRTTGTGRSSTALKRLKTAVFTPMPSASDTSATAVNPGVFQSIRTPYRMSCRRVIGSFVSRRPERVYFGRAASGDRAREEGDGRQKEREPRVGQRVCRGDLEE